MHQKRTKKLFLLTTWRMALTTKRTIILFFSERHLSRKKNIICTFCLAKCIRKGQKNCSFWLHEEWLWLSPQKEQIFCSFLNVFLERTSFVLFALPNASEKDKQIVPFEYMKNGSHHKKSNYFVPFWTSFVLFALPNASEKDKKLFLLTTWRMALTTKRAIILFLCERHLSRKERHLYFLPCQMHQKRTKKLFLLTTWRMALTTKRTIIFVPFWTSSF